MIIVNLSLWITRLVIVMIADDHIPRYKGDRVRVDPSIVIVPQDIGGTGHTIVIKVVAQHDIKVGMIQFGICGNLLGYKLLLIVLATVMLLYGDVAWNVVTPVTPKEKG